MHFCGISMPTSKVLRYLSWVCYFTKLRHFGCLFHDLDDFISSQECWNFLSSLAGSTCPIDTALKQIMLRNLLNLYT